MENAFNFVQEVFKGVDFTPEETHEIAGFFTRVNIAKGEHLLRVGEEIDSVYYISTGCLRTYYLDESGKEHTIQFAVNDWWISDYIALYGGNSTAVLNIECIQSAQLYKLNVEPNSFDLLCDRIPKVERFHRKKMEKAFASYQKRILANLSLSAKERYHLFVTSYPTIEQNIKNYHVASYLGITTESLSRIRKELV